MATDSDADEESSDSTDATGEGTPAETETETDRADTDETPRSPGWLDTRSGNGAHTMSEDWVRANHRPVSHDGRASTRTTFYPEDVSTDGPGQAHREPGERRSWGELAKWNDGMYSDISRGSKNFEADKKRWLATFAGHLECSEYHRERARYILGELDMGPFMGARIPVECVILGVLSMVIDADVETFENRAIERDVMQTLLDDLELDRRELVRTRHHLRRNTEDLFEPDDDVSRSRPRSE